MPACPHLLKKAATPINPKAWSNSGGWCFLPCNLSQVDQGWAPNPPIYSLMICRVYRVTQVNCIYQIFKSPSLHTNIN